MSNDKKPEWFEIVESDEPIQRRQRDRKSSTRPAIAFAAVGVIIGAGALIANAGEESPARAETSVSSSQIATSAATSTPTASTPTASTPTASTPTASKSDPSAPAPSTPAGGIQNPLTNGQRGSDDEFGERHDHKERFGDRGFRGERHDDGDRERFEDDDD